MQLAQRDARTLRIHRRPWSWVPNAVTGGGALISALVLGQIFLGSGHVRWDIVQQFLFAPVMLQGVENTLLLTGISLLGASVIGTVLATMRIATNPILRAIAASYIWFFRGTPLLVQVVFWFNLGLFMPRIGIGHYTISTNNLVTAMTAALLALLLNVSAYMCEVIRGGLIAVDRGQMEAALAIGMTPTRALTHIVLPQAVRVIVPAAGNLAIDLLKATSLVYVIGTREILGTAQSIASQNFYVVEMLIVASIWYLVLVSMASIAQARLEAWLARGIASAPARAAAVQLQAAL